MFKLGLVAALAALSTPALAGEIHVSLAGKDLPTIKMDVRKAAQQVCDEDSQAAPMNATGQDRCIDEVYASAMAQLKSRRPLIKTALERAPDPR